MEARRAVETTQSQISERVAYLASQQGMSDLSAMFPLMSGSDGDNDRE